MQLGVDIQLAQRYELAGFNGQVTEAVAALLTLKLDKYTFKGRYLLINQEWGIIGRNILNRLPLFLDGPHQKWSIGR